MPPIPITMAEDTIQVIEVIAERIEDALFLGVLIQQDLSILTEEDD